MRINVSCIYKFLLCVSVVSSCLLFILVASEADKSATDSLETKYDEINSTEARVEFSESEGAEEITTLEGTSLKSSFNEVQKETQATQNSNTAFEFEGHLSQNSGVSEGYSETNGVIFTVVDTASAELHQIAESTLEPSIVEEKQNTSTITLENIESNKTETVEISEINETRSEIKEYNETQQNKTEEKEEDIPSFSEWTQKQLEEAERKKEKGNISSNNQNVVKNINNLKLRSKNYASPDCGAKIVAANPEAVSAGAVLSSSRDEYKLNTCTSRIWFIVELCEAIQAKKIDLANFELFSSSPKDFIVSVSDRFPSRDWQSVGQFTAKDERDIQSFNLHPHLFGKYIKFEMLSHYGSEHFCPISLFRVYGTSEFEVLETEDNLTNDDEDDDENLDSYSGEPSNNLFGSARDAVMSIVKKAAEVLVKSSDSNHTDKQINNTKYSPLINSCTTPSRIIVCDNCSELMFGNVYELISCNSVHLNNLLNLEKISNLFYNTDICNKYGLNFITKTQTNNTKNYSTYLKTFLNQKYVAALCNVLAVIENKVVLNVSTNYLNNTNIKNDSLENIVDIETKPVLDNFIETPEVKTCAEATQNVPETSQNIPDTTVLETLDIKPTKTLSKSEETVDSETLEPSENILIPTENTAQKNLSDDMKTVDAQILDESENFEITDQLDNLLSELEESNSSVPSTPPPNVPQQAQKESVFLRLSSRIKALERNMSLSGQYLEELSRRYKKQVEEMQKAFEKKLSTINEDLKKRDEREMKMQEQIQQVTEKLNLLLAEKEGFWKTPTFVLQILAIQIFFVFVICYFRPKQEEVKVVEDRIKIVKKRRQSIDAIGHETPVVKKSRRPSEEALKITGTYEDLLIPEDAIPLSKAEKRRRRKRNALLRTQSTVEQKDKILLKRSSSFEIRHVVRKQSAPAQIYVNGDVSPPVKMQELPFALEESENTNLEPLQVYSDKVEKSSVKNGSLKSALLKSSPIFMKTALSSRSKRSRLGIFKTEKQNGKIDYTSQSTDLSIASQDSDEISSVGSKKEKKSGFRKIFKKVFE